MTNWPVPLPLLQTQLPVISGPGLPSRRRSEVITVQHVEMARPAPRSGGQKRPKPKKEPFPKCFPEDKLGKYLRLHPLRLRELPAHPQFTGWVDPKAGASPPTSSSQRPARPVAARPSVEAPTTAMHTAAPSPEPDPAPTARSTDLTVSPERDPTPSALSTDLRIQTNPGHLASDPAAVLSTSNDGQPTRARSASNPVEYGAAAEPSTARPTTAHPSLAIATQVATAPAVPKDQPPARTSLTIAPPDASAPAVPKGLPSPALSKRDEPALAASEITPSPPHSTVEFQDDRVVPGTGPEATNASNAETSRYGDNARSNLKSTSRFKKIRGGRPTGAGLSKERERSPSSASTRQGGQRPGLMDFIVALYKEAKEFTSDTVCHTFEKTKSKSSESSSARVQLLRRTISRERLSNIRWEDSRTHREPPAEHDYKTEHWHVRRSWHRPSKQPGTADISEFNRGLAVNHSINEMEYTPDIYEAHEVQTWDDQLKGMEFSNPEITEARMTRKPFVPHCFECLDRNEGSNEEQFSRCATSCLGLSHRVSSQPWWSSSGPP